MLLLTKKIVGPFGESGEDENVMNAAHPTRVHPGHAPVSNPGNNESGSNKEEEAGLSESEEGINDPNCGG